MGTSHMTSAGEVRRRATIRRILGAGAVALMVSTLLTGTSSADSFSNPTPIVVQAPGPPDGCPPGPGQPTENACPSTTALPYPSDISVDGVAGIVTDVNVTLRGLTHDSPADLDVMLEAPDGKTVMLMSDVCAADTDQNPISTPIDLTFDDSAPASIPADTPCATGTYKPFDDEDDDEFFFTGPDNFPDPAPAPAANASLSTFDGSPPNGTWSLWVVDDTPHDPGSSPGRFAGGWTLDINTPETTTTTSGDTTTTTAAGGTTTTTTGGGTTTTTATGGGTTTTTVGASPTLQLSATTVAPGDSVVLTGAGLPANAALQIVFSSDPVLIGAVTTNASGGFQTTVTIPADATAGPHRISVTDSGGRVLAASNVTVVRSAAGTGTATGAPTRTLARTGYGVQAMIVLATGLILLGYLMFSTAPTAATRRRPRRW